MELSDGSQRLISGWDTSGMEEDGCCCCCGGKAGLHPQNTLIQLLRQKETRLQRMAQFLAVALLLLISVVVALLLTLVLGGRGDSQPMEPPAKPPSGTAAGQKQHEDGNNPSAMLTAPQGDYTNVAYLEWENRTGNAFCQGGFRYSNGSLVVPRNGIYTVFLQITYESKEVFPDDCRSSNELRLNSKVSIIRDSYMKKVDLLSSVDTVSCNMEQWSKSLYTAGLFSLEANSRLHVTSSYRELIVKTESKVFFGAKLVPQ